MAKYKPTIPGRINVKDEATFMVPTVEIFRTLTEKITRTKVLECGNCHGKIVLHKNEPKPNICTECREEIDWTA